MARSKPQSNSFGDLQFAAFSWNAETEANYEKWLKSDCPSEFEALEYLVNAGYSVKFSPADDNGSFKVSATGIGTKHVNENVCITSWGNDTADALCITVFKIAIVFEGKSAPLATGQRGGRR